MRKKLIKAGAFGDDADKVEKLISNGQITKDFIKTMLTVSREDIINHIRMGLSCLTDQEYMYRNNIQTWSVAKINVVIKGAYCRDNIKGIDMDEIDLSSLPAKDILTTHEYRLLRQFFAEYLSTRMWIINNDDDVRSDVEKCVRDFYSEDDKDKRNTMHISPSKMEKNIKLFLIGSTGGDADSRKSVYDVGNAMQCSHSFSSAIKKLPLEDVADLLEEKVANGKNVWRSKDFERSQESDNICNDIMSAAATIRYKFKKGDFKEGESEDKAENITLSRSAMAESLGIKDDNFDSIDSEVNSYIRGVYPLALDLVNKYAGSEADVHKKAELAFIFVKDTCEDFIKFKKMHLK